MDTVKSFFEIVVGEVKKEVEILKIENSRLRNCL